MDRDLCLSVGELQLPNDWINVSHQMGDATAHNGELLCSACWTMLSPYHKSNPIEMYS